MTDFRKKYSPVGSKLLANIMLWAIFMMTFLLYYILKYDLKPTQNVPQTDIYELINWSSFFILTISSFILFTIFSFAAHKSDKEHDKVSGAKYMDIALAECSGILFNFGSLVLVITITTQEWIYLIATIVTYSLGVLIHPK